ncbi:outer membrane protein assembly factor BamA [Ascidiaceihabitans sp.]|nr:outer membrane protein assembly factor BamA [Ascidiaceihabitans sp.]
MVGVMPAGAQNYSFNKVVIDGNARIGNSAILSQAGIAPGQTISAGQLNDAFQRIQNSGLFESVAISPAGNTLKITVVERPTINRVNFEGNRRKKDSVLEALVSSAERRVFNPDVVEADAAKIAESYSNGGRLAARVTPKIIKRSDNRVDIVFEIFEGDIVEVERLSFVGNRIYSDRRLRRVLGTKQAGLFRALVKADTFVEGRIEFDKQVLREFYLSRGYIDFRTNSVNAELAQERDGHFIVFNIREGQQFKFGSVSTSSELNDVDGDEYQAVTKIRPGVVYSPTLVEQEIARMERLAIRQGVDFLRVEPRITRNDRDLTLDVEFVLSRGQRVFVERIDIEGNTTTLDRVIRRQFKSAEGDPFNPREIRGSAERIKALGFFANANIDAREGSSPDRVIVDVDVEEQPTGSLGFGGSFSANDGFGVAITLKESNFLGRGQGVNITFNTAKDSRRYGFNFIEPNFLGRDVRFGLNLNYAESDSAFSNFDSSTATFQPSLGFPVRENSRVQLRYTAEQVEIAARDTAATAVIILEDIGKQTASSIGYTYSYDTRISGLNPDAGVLLELSQDFAGLGGDSKYVKTTAKAVGQRRVLSSDVVLRATVEGGTLSFSGGKNRTVDRFILTPGILRGFEPGGIGPRDITSGDALGGNLYVAARFEAEFPVGLPEEYGLSGALFYDVGNLWGLKGVTGDTSPFSVHDKSDSLRHVVGFGILLKSPIGPLRFNFTKALQLEDYDRKQDFDFTLSTIF